MLIIAERLHRRPLTTGHLLIALLERPDEGSTVITNSLADVGAVTAAIIDALADETET